MKPKNPAPGEAGHGAELGNYCVIDGICPSRKNQSVCTEKTAIRWIVRRFRVASHTARIITEQAGIGGGA